MVSAFLSDEEIQSLLQEAKPLPEDFRGEMILRPKRGHMEFDLDLVGANGSEFRIVARRSNVNHLDFSVILAYRVPLSNQVLRLKRYNGKSHEHTNPIEREAFYGFHIHTATERYQQTGNREDTYAEVTARYANIEEAIRCLFEDCAFIVPEEPQRKLFPL